MVGTRGPGRASDPSGPADDRLRPAILRGLRPARCLAPYERRQDPVRAPPMGLAAGDRSRDALPRVAPPLDTAEVGAGHGEGQRGVGRHQGRAIVMARVLAIGLDGYEDSLGRRLMASGDMPCLARLRAGSAQFLLDHGPAQRTGLAGEHVSTGRSPRAADRWAAVHFDPDRYTVWQEGTKLRPFAADLHARTVVFDPPYFDLDQAPRVQGMVSWGAHDPGVPQAGRPADLVSECHARF